jgi:hypothetical protein
VRGFFVAHINNRAAQQPRSSFQVAGGVIMKFRHPYLAGQINDRVRDIDEIDVSRAVKLNEQFFEAIPNQDSAFQEVLVDGSTVSITNHLANGTITLPVVRTTGLVGSGDLIAACHLIVASKDSVGGTFTVIEDIDGKRITTLFWGVSVRNVPHLIKAGNAVPAYRVQLFYSGFIQAVSNSAESNKKAIWAVGNASKIEGLYKPYDLNTGGSTGDGPLDLVNGAGIVSEADDVLAVNNIDNADEATLAADSTYKNLDDATISQAV